MNFFLPSALGDTRRGTQIIRAYANSTMLTTTSCVAHFVLSKISTHLNRLKPKLIRSEKLNRELRQSNLNSHLFQNLKILRTSLPGMTSSANSIHPNSVLSPISCLGVYYDMIIVISFPCVCASASSDYDTWTKRHQVVQSLTKLNHKI